MKFTREEVLQQARDALEQGDPIGPYRLGDGNVNGLLDFLAQYDIEINSDGDVVDLRET